MKVLLIGSCVSRDAFELPEARDMQLIGYFPRSSLATATLEEPFVMYDDSGISSPFQRRVVKSDHQRQLIPALSNSGADAFLLDPIDERFDLVRHGGRWATRSDEFRLGHPSEPEEKRVPTGSEEHYSLWEAGWKRLVSTLEQNEALALLRIHAAHWAVEAEDGCISDSEIAKSRRANDFLDRLYARMGQDLLPTQFVAPEPRFALIATDHKWGRAAVHYPVAYYREFVSLFRSSLALQ